MSYPNSIGRKASLFSLFGIKREGHNGNMPGIAEVSDFIRQSENSGFGGCLLPESNNGPLHAWVFAHTLYTVSEAMVPFIAINPVYLHPFYAAKQIANFIVFFKRRLFINYITGTAKSDAVSLSDDLDSGSKYQRLTEFITVVDGLLAGAGRPFTFTGKFYQVKDLCIPFPVPADLLPRNFIAGSSKDALCAIDRTRSARLCMGMPLEELSALNHERHYDIGVHIGIIARPTKQSAIASLRAFSRYDREKVLLQHIATQHTGAVWKRELLEKAKKIDEENVYNLVAFRNFDSDVPYLVGSYEEVANYLHGYAEHGISLVVVEIPVTGDDEFGHLNRMRDFLNNRS